MPNQTYVTFAVTIPCRRKKMPEAILRALVAYGLVRPTKDAATVTEAVGYVTGWESIPSNPALPPVVRELTRSGRITLDNEV
jgi:hypothetical protein